MSDQLANGVIAMALGAGLALLLFVPTAAYQYRHDGRLGPRDLLVLASAPVYLLSLWTYTLLPFPDPGRFRCKHAELDPLASLRGLGTRDTSGLLGLLHDPVFLQLALNVALFVPLGWFLRVILRAGLAWAVVIGLGISALIEVTQLTGVWHLYDCAYRLFDTADLVTNTAGAVIGSVLSFLVLDRRDQTTPPLPTTVSLGRRLVGFACDALFLAIAGGTVAAAYRGWTVYGPGAYDRTTLSVLLLGVPFALQAISVLGVGRTIGEHVVAVRAVASRHRAARRVVKLLVGVTPAIALVGLSAAAWQFGAIGLPLLGLLHVAAAVATRRSQYRGLTGVLAGLDLRVATEEAFAQHPHR